MSVFANGREVSGKATPNKTIAEFPDVCMSPPSPPAGPIPIPYPITSMASKTSDGTGSVHIKKKEVGKKNGSTYGKCNGNEPATRSFGAGLMTATITGKTKFDAYSFDVLFEKSGAERFLDLTTGNHVNLTEAAPSPSVAAAKQAATKGGNPCKHLKKMNTKTKRQRKNIEDRRSPKATASSSTFKPDGGKSISLVGYSYGRDIPDHIYENEFAKGLPCGKKDEPGPESRLNGTDCVGSFQYAAGNRSNCTHAEPKMLEDILEVYDPPGTMIINIDSPTHDNLPCTNCADTLIEACACEIKIYLCMDDNSMYDYCEDPIYG